MPKNIAKLCKNSTNDLSAELVVSVNGAKKSNKNSGLALILLITIFSSISPLPAAILGIGGNWIFIFLQWPE